MIDTVQRVYSLANERNLSVYVLCRNSGVGYSTVATTASRNGQLKVDTIDRLCRGMGISVSEFFNVPDGECEYDCRD